ncbi:MAG TPA: alpha-E domain-containing protein [Caulobacteraceae bacterium]|jgi:uncharacterized alpha-E superfamily protein|nr:alpha-E domain-containing protein [Caulobacteraceae bacterium]
MMLARVADSLYWIGRYVERAEHHARVLAVMLNATVDRSEAAAQAAKIAYAAVGATQGQAMPPLDLARALTLDRNASDSVVVSLSKARENARQVRDQITREVWERLNLLYLRVTGARAIHAFADDPPMFLSEIVADLHLFRGAADATMSHGEGWRFMETGVHLERALLLARLLTAGFGAADGPEDPLPLVSLLRMACAVEPYLRAYTADLNSRFILQFLLFDEDFPRSIRYATTRIHQHVAQLARGRDAGHGDPQRLAGQLSARLIYADLGAIAGRGAATLLSAVEQECREIHQAIHDMFVAYPLETRLPA